MRSLVFSTIPFEFEPMPSDTYIVDNNLFGNNVGNMFFFNAAVKSLRCETHEIIRYEEGMCLNDYDFGIFIQANQIRNGTLEWINNDYNLIKGCKIPFVIVCIGTDSTPDFNTYLNQDVIDSYYRCYSEILCRTSSIGVRGDWTKKVLVEQIGLPEERIDVIGCPSVRYFGRDLKKFSRNYSNFDKEMKIAVNFTAYHYDDDEAIYLYKLLKEYRNSYIVFTDKVEADLLWKGINVPQNRQHELLPTTVNHFMMKQDRCRFIATQQEIMTMFKTFDFSIGSRIHQAIISIISGCPALLIAHSTRVLEIAEYHNIPYILRTELVETQPSLETLYYRACTGMIKFYKSYDDKLVEYTNFLKKNNLIVNPDYN